MKVKKDIYSTKFGFGISIWLFFHPGYSVAGQTDKKIGTRKQFGFNKKELNFRGSIQKKLLTIINHHQVKTDS